ncbi:hypothetical protein ACFFKU_00380 [Kineococcus gynurae]|uniref:Uncharacterized protein n=1 Tax=Kineococcus gynurae TaxID=452979 RepID=A0ABV5LXI1_9ACTN
MSAAVGACSLGGPSAEDVTFSVPDVSPLMDSESAVVLRVSDPKTGEVSASEVVDIDGETDVDEKVSVVPGTYSVWVAQLHCPMGDGCPDEASAPRSSSTSVRSGSARRA